MVVAVRDNIMAYIPRTEGLARLSKAEATTRGVVVAVHDKILRYSILRTEGLANLLEYKPPLEVWLPPVRDNYSSSYQARPPCSDIEVWST